MSMGKDLQKKQTKRNIPIRVATILLCLTVFSTYFVSGIYARYSTNGQNTLSARVAKFSVEGSGTLMQPIEVNVAPGEAEATTLNIYNNSEVAVEYTVTITNVTKNLPLHFRMEKAGGSTDASEDGITLTGQQLAIGHTDQYTLYIEWKEEDNNPAQMGMVDYITVTITAVQID